MCGIFAYIGNREARAAQVICWVWLEGVGPCRHSFRAGTVEGVPGCESFDTSKALAANIPLLH